MSIAVAGCTVAVSRIAAAAVVTIGAITIAVAIAGLCLGQEWEQLAQRL